MTDSDRLALVAIAVARGVTVDEGWAIVDHLGDQPDLRAASLAVEQTATHTAFPVV